MAPKGYVRKKYSELRFVDDFMFCKILTSNPDLCRELIELIIGIKIRNIEFIDKQKEIKETYDGKGIRLDVYVEDDFNTVYDLEMQTVLKSDLPKRIRYYQGMIDQKLIKAGESYSSLRNSVIIFICLEDPFDENLPVYTFAERCSEKLELSLGDKTSKVIINASGSREGLSDEMVAFLDYLSENKMDSDFVKRIESEVDLAKYQNLWEDEYMTLQMKLLEEREEGREEGRTEKTIQVYKNCIARGMKKEDAIAISEIKEEDIPNDN